MKKCLVDVRRDDLATCYKPCNSGDLQVLKPIFLSKYKQFTVKLTSI